MDHELLRAAADLLLEMRRTQRIERDLPPGLRPHSLDDAYAVQDLVVDGLLPVDAGRIGYKVACTSVIAQEALQIDGPLFGQLLSNTCLLYTSDAADDTSEV